MNNRQIYISLEIIGVIAVLAGIGAYLYFVQPLPQLIPDSWQQEPAKVTAAPTASPSPTLSPTPAAQKTLTVTVTEVQENNRFKVTTEDGSELILELNLEEELSVEDRLKLYLSQNSEITRVEKLTP